MTRISGFVLTLIAILTNSIAFATGINGDWNGKLLIGGNYSLRIVIHINEEDKGVTLDSPDQGAYGIEGKINILSNDSLDFNVPSLYASYSGNLRGNEIIGTFRQGGMSLPLTLQPGTGSVNRPQTPVGPKDYTTEAVRIENKVGGSILAGTLTVPANATGETPVVVMVSGSGLQNRDEELFEHKPFAVIADYLADHGIASLRYDDRGFGESSGDAFNATTEDFASDAQAVIDWLRSQKRFGKTGLLGHSEGGLIGYMLGAKKDNLDFLISVAGPSVKGTKTIAYQNKFSLVNNGVPESTTTDFVNALEKVFEFRLENPETAVITDEMISNFYPQYNQDELTRKLTADLKNVLSSVFDNVWMAYFLAYDPQNDMRNLKTPTLIIYGEKDCQVPVSLNLYPAQAYSPAAEIKVFKDLNHLMQHAKTGAVVEYGEIEETFSPEVLFEIKDFITRRSSTYVK